MTGKIDWPDEHPMLAHFTFLERTPRVTPKMTIPSPSVLHFRQGTTAITATYPDIDEFFADAAALYRHAVKAFYNAGCRYLQLDDTVWVYLCGSRAARACDRARRRCLAAAGSLCPDDQRRARGDDRTISRSLMIVCRGNFRSTWISSGGYEPVAETLLGRLNIDGYFLEYEHRARGRLRAAPLPAKGTQDGRPRPHHLERVARSSGKTM